VEAEAEIPSQGWLGVGLADVPEALRAHFGLNGPGMILQEVYPDGPAAKAGLKMHDIILRVDAHEVDEMADGFKWLVDYVRKHDPGDVLSLQVLQAGERKNVEVTLGDRAEAMQELKVKLTPQASVQEEIDTKARVYRRGEGGEWVVQDLFGGNQGQAGNATKEFQFFQGLPTAERRSISVSVKDGQRQTQCTVHRNDETITITQEGEDGPVRVQRSDGKGNQETNLYSSTKDFKAADPEAYKWLKQSSGDVQVEVQLEGLDDMLHRLKKLNVESVDMQELKQKLQVREQDVQKQLEEARRQLEEARVKFQKLKEMGVQVDYADPFHNAVRAYEHAETSKMNRRSAAAPAGQPVYQFMVKADGTIVVTVRKGDSELVREYANKGELRQKSEDLYKRFVKMYEAID
jgi:hypothetical protein